MTGLPAAQVALCAISGRPDGPHENEHAGSHTYHSLMLTSQARRC